MAVDVKLKPVSINFTLKDHIYDVLRESILKVDIYDADAELRPWGSLVTNSAAGILECASECG